MAKRPKAKALTGHWRPAVLVLGVIAVIVLCLIFVSIFSNSALQKLQNNVLENPKVLSSEKVISEQNTGSSTVDPGYSLHVIIERSLSKELLEKNILKACTKSKSQCSNPTWNAYDILNDQQQLGLPEIVGETTKIQCTYTWKNMTDDGTLNYRDTVCINPDSGDLWYEYFEI